MRDESTHAALAHWLQEKTRSQLNRLALAHDIPLQRLPGR